MPSPIKHLRFALCLLVALSASAVTLKKAADRKPVFNFELQDPDRKAVHLSNYAGKVVLLNFWATWCGPCKGEIPWLIEFSNQYKDQGLVVLGVSLDEDGWSVIKPYAARTHMTYPLLLGDKSLKGPFGDLDALPVTYFIDRNQKVAAIQVGAGTRKQFESTIQTLLK